MFSARGWTKPFELNFLKKNSFRWSHQLGKIILTAGQLAQCLALNQTSSIEHDNIIHKYKRIYMKVHIFELLRKI